MRDKGERRHRRTWANPACVELMATADFDRAPSLAEAMGLEGPEDMPIEAEDVPAENHGVTDAW